MMNKPASSPSKFSKQRGVGIILILISAAAFGAMPIFANYAYSYGTEPITVLFLRFLLSSIIMLMCHFIRKARFPRGKILLAFILMGAVGYAGQSFSYFTALLYASSGTVAIIFYLYPALVTVLSILFLRQRIFAIEITALVLALTGTLCVIGLEFGGKPLGVILGITAAMIYSVYIITGSKIMPKTDVMTSSTIIMMSAGVVYTLAILVRGAHFPSGLSGWGAIGGIVVVSTVIAIVTFFEGLKRIGPVHSSMLSTLEPVVTVVLAWVFFNEGLTPLKFLGGALILVAGILLARKSS
ncbi:MAG: DMT family transporter [Desulfobacteraceae bacterium]|nr:DMT family transporter [Desulfobacteraceae bacterium]